MNTMDNAKVIQAMEKFSLQKYLDKLIHSEMHRITLFAIFSQTGAPNLSSPSHLFLVDDLSQLVELNSGAYLN